MICNPSENNFFNSYYSLRAHRLSSSQINFIKKLSTPKINSEGNTFLRSSIYEFIYFKVYAKN